MAFRNRRKLEYQKKNNVLNSPFCVPAKEIKVVGIKNGGRISPTNLITFAVTQNGEYGFNT
jgi:hypothetical protein